MDYTYVESLIKRPKKNDLIKARRLCNIFRFIDDLYFINDSGKLESNYSNIYPEELQLCKENIDKHDASFLDLIIKIKDGKFHFSLFDKRDSFPFSFVRMPNKSSNVPSSIDYSAIRTESLRTARASSNPESFSTAITPLITRMSRQAVSIGNINSSILKFFNKHDSHFNNVCQSKQELLNLKKLEKDRRKIINDCVD